MRELTGAQRRQLVDCEQLFALWRTADRTHARRFRGSMSWKTVSGRRYLYRKIRGRWTSLGPESERTRLTYESFVAGRTGSNDRLQALDLELRRQARIARAMDLGRVPTTVARLLRRLDRAGIAGRGLRVAGTNALYAYERMGGVHFGADLAATMDVDLLYDARGTLDLVAGGLGETGMMGLLTGIDATFRRTAPGSFRAANDAGFMVDLITPATRDRVMRQTRLSLGSDAHDLAAVEIDGLAWLESSPAIERIVLDERGFPLVMVVPDPRAFACHKLWVSERDDREPIKRGRDREQAAAVADMLARYLPELRFDDPVLSALPRDLRERGARLAEEAERRIDVGEPGDWL